MTDPDPPLGDGARALLHEARRAVLTTIDARDGRPRSVPICFAIIGATLYSPLDEKPKAGAGPRDLRRVRNIAADPRATILVDRWDEDWTRLAFVEVECHGRLLEPGSAEHEAAVNALRQKYAQYAGHQLQDRPVIRFTALRATTWWAQPVIPADRP